MPRSLISRFPAVLCLIAACFVTGQAHAGLLFGLGFPTGVARLDPDEGLGQGVAVAHSATINDFGFFAQLPNGGDVKFLIWDGAHSNLLFSETKAVGASSALGFLDTGAIAFTLDAGSTYYFGIIANDDLALGYSYPQVPHSQNGLTALTTGNALYQDFANPSLEYIAFAQIPVEIFSAAAVPEMSTWAMTLMGLLCLGAASYLRRKLPAFDLA